MTKDHATSTPRKALSNGSVRSLARGLSILRHVNKVGEARPGEIAKALGIPRPTVYRLLETLEELGYVAFSATSNYVRVTRFAAALGDGYALTSEITQAAGPIFGEYAKRVVWPLDLSVYNNAAMVVQETTHGRSPLSIDRGMTGFRMPVLRTSAGRAYMAFCPDEERNLILDHLRRLNVEEDQPYLEEPMLSHLLDDTRARGFAIRDSGEFRQETASIAVPILSRGVVLGCISLIWIRSAMTTRRAAEDYGAPLREIAEKIAASLPD
ncbi:DNA-binding transcriptional regulator [Celeribacter sp. PS-C1]|uniref:DNA-binding transcriptional regulator n=1 Tax=Celeribacter sp. PS-C1 TaxID=2820813 RepID=UPI001CA51AE6|nr:DNA-binding transcriptional regulator [Celeribacter sp. PS-C1]MBW6417600.1 DNA-binding transcriptional regulator [Celeribacter sp. PS-C1]